MALQVPFRKALATNSTSTAFTAQVATTTEPTGDGVFNLTKAAVGWGLEHNVPSHFQLVPYGTAADNDIFDFRVWGYSRLEGTTVIYIPLLLLDVSVVLSATTGTPIAANTFLADTLTINDGGADNAIWQRIISPAEDLAASVVFHTRGCQYLLFDWDSTGATSMNCLIRPFTVD